MAKVIVHTDKAPTPSSPCSQAVRAGGFVFVSGQAPLEAKTGEIVGTTIQEQTAQSLRNVSAILRAAGTSLEKVVSAGSRFPSP
jgi:2-iminobutanoate/2-iminopropanoate deaminase